MTANKIAYSPTNDWEHCELKEDNTLEFMDGDYRQGGVILSSTWYEHRNGNYWFAVRSLLATIERTNRDYHKRIITMIQENNVYDYIVNKIREAESITYKEVTSISLANKMIKNLIQYQLRGRTYSDAMPNQYIKDFNEIFEKVRLTSYK